MIVLAQIAAFVGWRGGVSFLAGAVLATVPAFQAGVFTQTQVCQERVARSIATHDLRRMELENDRIADAKAARLRAGAQHSDSAGGMRDDAFRRD